MSPVRTAGGVAASMLAGRRVWLCDLDGTLVDSGPAHEAAFRDAIAETAPELLASFRYHVHAGASTRDVVATLGVDPATADRLTRRKQQLYRRYVDAGRVTVLPGAYRLLDHLARGGRVAYVVTSGSRGSVDRVLAACSLAGRVRAVLTSDDLPSSKPDPAVYREACRRWDVDPDDAVAVEDSAQGVAAAVGAGLLTLRVPGAGPALAAPVRPWLGPARDRPGAFPVRHLDDIVSLLGGRTEGGRR